MKNLCAISLCSKVDHLQLQKITLDPHIETFIIHQIDGNLVVLD